MPPMLRYKLRTLLIVLGVAPPALALVYWTWGTDYSLLSLIPVLVALWADFRNAQAKRR